MNDDLKKQIDSIHEPFGFIKVTDNPVSGLNDQQKVLLNRKANALYNEGKFDQAERIYITTGYSDGLTRIGEKYQEKNNFIQALRLYLLAHNKRKSDPLLEKFSSVVSTMLKED